MARKLYYKILADGQSQITDVEWDEILRLQHWYNSEFFWTAGKLSFKMFAVFPKIDLFDDEHNVLKVIQEKRREYKNQHMSENDIIRAMEADGLIIVKKGGYFDDCIASGFTRVAANEWNAYLVCEFLVKASFIAPNAIISVYDEGLFIKSKQIKIKNGIVYVPNAGKSKCEFLTSLVTTQRVFSVVDPEKYNEFPQYQNTIPKFNELDKEEKFLIIKDWHWLGYDDNFDKDGNDVQGVDLNKKIRGIVLSDFELY